MRLGTRFAPRFLDCRIPNLLLGPSIDVLCNGQQLKPNLLFLGRRREPPAILGHGGRSSAAPNWPRAKCRVVDREAISSQLARPRCRRRFALSFALRRLRRARVLSFAIV